MKNKLFLFSFIMILFSFFIDAAAETYYSKQINEHFNYEIIIPSGWKHRETTRGDVHSFAAEHGNSEIRVRVFNSGDSKFNLRLRALLQEFSGFSRITNIIDGEKLSSKSTTARFHVHQYRFNKKTYLHRSMFARSENMIYAVDCKSPLNTFYWNEKSFNIAFASFKTISGSPLLFAADETELLTIDNEEEYTEDFTEDARKNGFRPPKTESDSSPIKIYLSSDKNDPENLLDDGVVLARINMPVSLEDVSNSVYLWKNGEETLIGRNIHAGASITSNIILINGKNYFCATVKKGNIYLFRSPLVRLQSRVPKSLARFEMTWDGMGDMDLHLDNVKAGWHVNFSNLKVNTRGYSAYLDVDNMAGYGPENIRVLSAPKATRVRCFVNYYSGFSPLKVTIRHYDRNNRLVKTYSRKISTKDISPTNKFNRKSKVIGYFNIRP